MQMKVCFNITVVPNNRGTVSSRRTRGGMEGDQFMVCQPLIISDDEIRHLIELLDKSLFELAKEIYLSVGTQK
jgi:hypothetical protein